MTKSYYYSRYYKVPGTTVGILSLPSKMPGYGWGMTAKISCPYAVTGPGAICNSCYATKGRYVFGDVANAYRQRFAWARRCMRSEDGQQEFIELLVRAIRKTATTYFRVHDSGDLFSPVYTRCWIAICKALPDVRFWFPTRSYQAP